LDSIHLSGEKSNPGKIEIDRREEKGGGGGLE